MTLSQLFARCVNRSYRHVENGADFVTDRACGTLSIYLQCSKGLTDWKNNLDFPARPYRRDGGVAWYAHRGFLKVWKSVEPYLRADILDPGVSRIVTVGYSHGAALAVLCHEYAWYHRPDLRDALEGYGFGCPRVLWGVRRRELLERWERFWVIRNIDDIVTHVPPAWLGYLHVGELLEIGVRGRYSRIDAHRPENILAELRAMELDAYSATASMSQLRKSPILY